MVNLTPEERSILKKMTVKQLRDNTELIKYLKTLLDTMNLLLDNEREWFMTVNEPDPGQLAKKHYAFKSNLLICSKIKRIIQASEQELAVREDKREK
jgi:hypothetical protein